MVPAVPGCPALGAVGSSYCLTAVWFSDCRSIRNDVSNRYRKNGTSKECGHGHEDDHRVTPKAR
jgi:hypothetical protein